MALDALKGYLQLASGLGDLTRAKATEAADALLSLSSSLVSTPVASQVASLADEMMSAAATNRESLKALVRAEVESAVARALAAQGAELDRARVAVARLGRGVSRDAAAGSRDGNRRPQVATDAQQGSPVSSPITRNEGSMATKKAAPAKTVAVKKAVPAKTAAVKKAVPATSTATKTTPAKKAVSKKAVSTKTAPTKQTPPAKRAPAKKAVTTAAKVTAKKVTAKKTTPTKTTAKKAAPATAKKATAPSPAKKRTARKTSAKK